MTIKQMTEKVLEHWKRNWEAFEGATEILHTDRVTKGRFYFHIFSLDNGKKASLGSAVCTYCIHFIYDECHKCPIQKETKRKHCLGTPYERIQPHMSFSEAKTAILAEYKFIRDTIYPKYGI